MAISFADPVQKLGGICDELTERNTGKNITVVPNLKFMDTSLEGVCAGGVDAEVK